MKRIKLVMTTLAVGLFLFQGVSYAQHDHQQSEEKAPATQQQVKESYTCPMHPDVLSDKPGKCPQCGMTLEKKELSAGDRQEKMSAMMGKPTFEKSVEGVQVRVWLITQNEHKKMMGTMMENKKDSAMSGSMMHREMKHDVNKMDPGMMGMMMHGKKDSSTGGGMMHGEMKEMDHGKMGEGMKHEEKDIDHEKMMETMMGVTHHVMVTVTDGKSKESLDKEKVTINVVSPSGKSSNVELSSMMGHFGGSLSLEEQGTYVLDIVIEDAQKTRTMGMPYEVKESTP